MTITEKNTLEIRTILKNLIGSEVTARSLFAGYGIFHDEYMFGMYHNGIFYLRAKHQLAEYLENNGAARWIAPNSSTKLTINHYYQLPNAITQNTVIYKQVVIESIQQMREEKLIQHLKKLNRIKELPNLSIKYERLLAKVDIRSIKELKIIGAVNAYVRLKKNGYVVNLQFFWNLFAALQNRNANLLTHNDKEAALKILNVALANAGLRKIKGNNAEL